MTFHRLPNELLLSVMKYLTLQKDTNSFARANVRLYNLLNAYLYGYNVEQNQSSALLWAAKNGQEDTAKTSIAEGANIRLVSEADWTPLSWAAFYGNETVVKLLLVTDSVDPDSRIFKKQTPLSMAAWNSHGEVVKLLLATQSVQLDSKISTEETPLSLAAYRGHKEVVKMLLATGGVDPCA
ncbi:hypothetical protein N7520_000290 [Penicillium odoratum]|uniref:uncharacterized protein n=1 Tax=Penicillium odoratum TaxID=1167516 RepID=UPI0025485963|nr:uncharacterized protein N7520_000290 [Penicillium odoratum]KAJ5777044.1 hypothetical protein N7520_000290 [Penicillium odoratum]